MDQPSLSDSRKLVRHLMKRRGAAIFNLGHAGVTPVKTVEFLRFYLIEIRFATANVRRGAVKEHGVSGVFFSFGNLPL